MNYNKLAVVFATVFTLATVTAAQAGREHARDGLFIGFGVGAGSGTLDSDLDSKSGGMGMFRIGFAPKNNLVVGLESNAWTRTEGGATITFSVAGPGVTYYPGNNGFFVKGAIGVGTVDAEANIGIATVSASDSGLGIITALGWEARLTRKFALGIEGIGSFLSVSDNLNGTRFVGANLIFNWYWSHAQ